LEEKRLKLQPDNFKKIFNSGMRKCKSLHTEQKNTYCTHEIMLMGLSD